MAISLWHHWNNGELLYFYAQIYVDLEKKVHAMEHWDLYRVCHFDIHVYMPFWYTYIYIYIINIYVCLCVYTSLLKKMFWMNIHLPAIFDLAEQVLRLHKHLTWTAMEGQTYWMSTHQRPFKSPDVQWTRATTVWGYWDFRCTAWLHGWFLEPAEGELVTWANMVPQRQFLQLGSQNFQGKAAAH